MRLRNHCLTVAFALALVGCGGRNRVDTSAVEIAFEMVAGTNRALVDAAVADARSGQFQAAAVGFRELERRYRLSPRQELAVKTVLRDLDRRQPSRPATNAAPAAP